MKVWCSEREKQFVIEYMGRQGWVFAHSRPDGPDQLEMIFNHPPLPPPPTHEAIVLCTACGCERVIVSVPYGIQLYEVPLAASTRTRAFKRIYHKRDDWDRAYFVEVIA